jgi:hypothetical protein
LSCEWQWWSSTFLLQGWRRSSVDISAVGNGGVASSVPASLVMPSVGGIIRRR